MPIGRAGLVHCMRYVRATALCGAIAVALSAVLTLTQAKAENAAEFDVVIRGGRIVDGTGNPWFYGDVAIKGDRIVAIGKLPMPAPNA